MTAVLRWILSVAITFVVIAFALVNRSPVEIIWSPVHAPASLPLFLPVLIGTVFGFFSGGFMVWLNGAATRHERRRQKKIICELEKQIDRAAEKKDSGAANKAA